MYQIQYYLSWVLTWNISWWSFSGIKKQYYLWKIFKKGCSLIRKFIFTLSWIKYKVFSYEYMKVSSWAGKYHRGPWIGTNMCPHRKTYGIDPQHRVPWMAMDWCHCSPCHNQCQTTSHPMTNLPPPWCGHDRVFGHDQINALNAHQLDHHPLQLVCSCCSHHVYYPSSTNWALQ